MRSHDPIALSRLLREFGQRVSGQPGWASIWEAPTPDSTLRMLSRSLEERHTGGSSAGALQPQVSWDRARNVRGRGWRRRTWGFGRQHRHDRGLRCRTASMAASETGDPVVQDVRFPRELGNNFGG